MFSVHVTFLQVTFLHVSFCEPVYYLNDSIMCVIQEKEDWINAIGRSIVRHSRSVTDEEVLDYDSKRAP